MIVAPSLIEEQIENPLPEEAMEGELFVWKSPDSKLFMFGGTGDGKYHGLLCFKSQSDAFWWESRAPEIKAWELKTITVEMAVGIVREKDFKYVLQGFKGGRIEVFVEIK